MHFPRVIFSLKYKRFVEWTRDLRAERADFEELRKMMVLAIKAAFWSGRRKNYRARLNTCQRCPTFDKRLKRCRNGADGCGCYTPYKALAPVNCWRTENDMPGGWAKLPEKNIVIIKTPQHETR